MSQSKSLLMPFIIIAVLIFGGALAWKTFNSDESSAVNNKPIQTVKQEERKVKKKTIEQEDFTIIEYEKEHEVISDVDTVLLEKQKEASPNMMRFAMKYKTKEDVLRGLKYLNDSNKHEEFEHLIMYAERTFPDLEIPSFE